MGENQKIGSSKSLCQISINDLIPIWLCACSKSPPRHGPIHYQDGNQGEYLADFVPVEKKFYPYRDAASILDEWFRARPDDQGLRDKLTVSGLSSALKADKRAELAEKLTNIADMRVDTELRIGREEKRNGKGAR